MKKKLIPIFIVTLLVLFAFSVHLVKNPREQNPFEMYRTSAFSQENTKFPRWITIEDTVRIRDYFNYIDSLVVAYDSLTEYSLSEHSLVRSNPWIIDRLVNTDYYRMIERDSFVYDQKQMIILRSSDSLLVPDSVVASQIIQKIKNTRIDINIPEFKLRIYEDSTLLYTFPVRVGQHRKRYLKMGDRITDLRTQTGKGAIVDYRRNPVFYNPVDGKRFYLTKRDDGRRTLMPQIPWIETEINGVRNGQLIHPTTNPKSLEKAYSNGCIGVREADAWIIYYHAPVGTPVTIRYDLMVTDSVGNVKVLEDIYDENKRSNLLEEKMNREQ